jgi:hypothetical protein
MPANNRQIYKVINLFIPEGRHGREREAFPDEQQIYYIKANENDITNAAHHDHRYHFELAVNQRQPPTHRMNNDNGTLTFTEIPIGGRSRSSKSSKKRPTAHRRRSSKARKARATRRK